MEKMTNFDRKKGISFAIAVLGFIGLIIFAPAWCWVALPFVCTFFVEMLGWLR